MSLLKPADIIDHVSQITPEFLARRGLRGLVLDLDNTLIPYKSYADASEIVQWAQELRGAGLKLYLLSNATAKRAAFWLPKLGFPGVGMAGKPNPRAFKQAAAELGLPVWQVGMAGDQLFTDVLGGNLAGLHTILVHPLIDNALPHTKITRKLERRVLKRYGHDWQP